MVKEKNFYRTLFIVALPAAFQALISMSVNMLDNLMVGSLGDISLASVAQANQVSTLFTFIVNGIGGGRSSLPADPVPFLPLFRPRQYHRRPS